MNVGLKIMAVAILSAILLIGQYFLFVSPKLTAGHDPLALIPQRGGNFTKASPGPQLTGDDFGSLTPFADRQRLIASRAVISREVIIVTRDSFIIEGDPNNNAGAETQMWAGGGGSQSMRRRSLIYFDLATAIPTDSTILTVTVHLDVVGGPNDGVNSSFRLNRLTRRWGEGTKIGTRGQTATDGEVTWIAAEQAVTNWHNSGADFVITASATTAVTGIDSYTWDTTPRLVADVQDWLDAPTTNFGWLLRSDDEFTSRTVRRFGTREGGNPALITVDYMPPQPILRLTKTASRASVKPGDRITYTLVAENSGNLTATAVTISDTLPLSVTLATTYSVEPLNLGGVYVNGTLGSLPILVSGVTLPPGARITVTVPVSLSASVSNGTIITNTASVTDSQASEAVIAQAIVTVSRRLMLHLPLLMKDYP